MLHKMHALIAEADFIPAVSFNSGMIEKHRVGVIFARSIARKADPSRRYNWVHLTPNALNSCVDIILLVLFRSLAHLLEVVAELLEADFQRSALLVKEDERSEEMLTIKLIIIASLAVVK